MRRGPFAGGLAALFVAASAVVAQDDPGPIRSVIQSQLEAFLRDDGDGAWTHASPGIQQMFRDRDTFMAMVRQGYAPVYRPKEWSFGELRASPQGPEQAVRIVDVAGDIWIAIYTMERQPDGTWKISGCRLVKAPAESA